MRVAFSFLLVTLASVTLAQNLKSGGRLRPDQAIMDIRHYTVELAVDPAQQSIQGTAEIDLNLLTRTPDLVFDLWRGLTVTQVSVGSRKETFVQTKDDLLKIRGLQPFEKGKIKVRVTYGG